MNAVKLQQEFVRKDSLEQHCSNENQLTTRNIPKGYMTGKEFWRLIREAIDEICKK